MPSGAPAAIDLPARTRMRLSGAYDTRHAPQRTLTVPSPATFPANTTRPAHADRTGPRAV
jgi:hypothetical protein